MYSNVVTAIDKILHSYYISTLVTHDESVFYQNDIHKTHWIASTSKATPLPKGDGQSIMISDFLTSEWCCLVDETADGVSESVSIL